MSSDRQEDILAYLAEHGPSTVREISKDMRWRGLLCIDAVARTELKRLESEGKVRVQDPDDYAWEVIH